jgi:hypothetical protein
VVGSSFVCSLDSSRETGRVFDLLCLATLFVRLEQKSGVHILVGLGMESVRW